ncbi:copper resistance protein CopC/CopD [bacterium]|nr:copper resistance protein CopC/CopD [bacterium]
MFSHWTTSIKRFLVSIAASLGLVIFLQAGPVLAHNSFNTSTPSDGSTLEVSPALWLLEFSKEVPLASASAEIISADGVRTALQAPIHGATTNTISFALPTNLAGGITARWRLVGVDGHVISGRVRFTVQTTTSASIIPSATVPATTIIPNATVPAATSTTIVVTPTVNNAEFVTPIPELPRQVFRFINYGALLMLIGIIFIEFDIARGALGLVLAQRVLRIAAISLAASAMLQLMIFNADLTGKTLFGSLGSFGAALDTTPGSMLIMKVLISCIIGLVAFKYQIAQASPRKGWWVPVLLLQYLITLAYTGHSRSQRWPILGIPMDVVHTVAAGVWLGGLLGLLWIVVPSISDHEAIHALQRFGSAAKIAVIALVFTGLFQTLRLHNDPWSIFTSSHGQILLVKLLFFAAMLKYADRNRRLLDQRSVNETNIGRIKQQLVRSSLIETACGLGVVAATAVLVSSSLGT